MDNKVGDVIEVIYDEENPENMVVKKRNHITFMLAFMDLCSYCDGRQRKILSSEKIISDWRDIL